ncbi:hypothetical protein OJ997_23315 [Solirubrobacter phytolaccae]|uniref:Secreted protein n=1 Tax=Solirubrobacter phytolaccae TaxID=1404360 RepID=A0A9X3SD45_9ACTN|nr:hypothetical protein [Solirubrobacter phytolaccae]MDA0183260.1 hypothetical protein [Solirubrobacter phytolaccae]
MRRIAFGGCLCLLIVALVGAALGSTQLTAMTGGASALVAAASALIFGRRVGQGPSSAAPSIGAAAEQSPEREAAN